MELCDNIAVTRVAIIRTLAPFPIHNLMSGDTPMIETNLPVAAMMHLQVLNEIPRNYKIQGNNATSFVDNVVKITVNLTSREEMTCFGLF